MASRSGDTEPGGATAPRSAPPRCGRQDSSPPTQPRVSASIPRGVAGVAGVASPHLGVGLSPVARYTTQASWSSRLASGVASRLVTAYLEIGSSRTASSDPKIWPGLGPGRPAAARAECLLDPSQEFDGARPAGRALSGCRWPRCARQEQPRRKAKKVSSMPATTRTSKRGAREREREHGRRLVASSPALRRRHATPATPTGTLGLLAPAPRSQQILGAFGPCTGQGHLALSENLDFTPSRPAARSGPRTLARC